jgi:CRP/FNR family transcriptional regulator, cyclic AMP receptor protein
VFDSNLPDSPYVIDNIKGFEKQLEILLSVSNARRYNPGEIIYLQGETSKDFYFLAKGKVKVSILKENGSEKILAIQEDNTFFGESGSFDRHPYFATATALDDSEIFVIPIDRAEAVIREHPDVSFMVINAIIRKLRLLGLQVEDFAFLDAQKRVAHILLKLASEIGQEHEEGIIIQKRITHEDLASLTGLSRVRVTTLLNHFQRLNIIRKRRLIIIVTDHDKLASLLGEPSQEQSFE